MFKKLKLKHYMFILWLILVAWLFFAIFTTGPGEDMADNNILYIASTPANIELTEENVYIHNIIHNRDGDMIEYTVTNASHYWHGFSQMILAFKLIDDEWFEIGSDLSALPAWIDDIPPGSSTNRSFRLNLFFGQHTPPDGVYMFKKPLLRWDYIEGFGLGYDIEDYSWLHLIIELTYPTGNPPYTDFS